MLHEIIEIEPNFGRECVWEGVVLK